MKILIINSGELPVPPVEGGAVEGLINMFIEDKKIQQSYDCTVISKYSLKAYEESKKYNCNFKFINTNGVVYRFEKAIRFIINKISPIYIGNAYISRVKKLLKNTKYDLIIIENTPQYGLILKHFFSKYLVLHLHNDYLNASSKFNKKILETYDKIFAISNYIKKRIDSVETTNKVEVLYNGVDLNQFKVVEKDYKLMKKFNISETDFVFICSGRIVSEKGILELIKAFNKVSLKNEVLLIVGSPYYGTNKASSYMRKVLEVAKKNNRIHFTGYIKHSEIGRLYSIGDFGIIPSKCNEAFGLSAVEFLASGMPVIVTNDGALPEIVNEKSGIIIDKNNLERNLESAIKKVRALNSKEFNNMKKEALLNSRVFSRKKYCEKFNNYISIYKV